MLAICTGSGPVIMSTSIDIKASVSTIIGALGTPLKFGGEEVAKLFKACFRAIGEVAPVLPVVGSGLAGDVGDVGSLSLKLPDMESILKLNQLYLFPRLMQRNNSNTPNMFMTGY